MTLSNLAGATWDITDNSGFTLGASAASYIANSGTFEKTGVGGVSTIAASFTGSGTVDATVGTIAFAGPSTTVSGSLTGAGLVEFTGGTTTFKSGAIVTVAKLAEYNAGTVVAIAGR